MPEKYCKNKNNMVNLNKKIKRKEEFL